MTDDAKVLAGDLREIARDMLIYEGDCREVESLNKSAALIERLAAEVERLTPKPMTADEIIAAFNQYGVRLLRDWVLIQGHDDDEPVLSSNSTLWWYHVKEARYIAQGLRRDADAAAMHAT